MSKHLSRLPAGDHPFSGRLIDRGQPLRFELNGRVIEGFAGDTVLSAALAAGITVAGLRDGAPLGLDEHFAPPVVSVDAPERANALPMDRLPAREGMRLVSIGARHRRHATTGTLARLRHLLYGPGRSLGHVFDRASALAGPWIDLPPGETLAAGLCVVGGGVAGMAAALYGARLGERVVLVERGPVLGGLADYFGTTEGEEPVHKLIPRLRAEIAAEPAITVLTRAEAFAVYDREVRVHQVVAESEPVRARVLAVETPRIVLATGTAERLPVFPGNRSPGVVGAATAFLRAERYGLWLGHRAMVVTGNNVAYRLARLARDAGLDVLRVVDPRRQPQSRFIDFAKAYGIGLMRGTQVHMAEPARGNLSGLWVQLADTGTGPSGAPVWTDQLILGGGWQPALALWHMAGGHSRWNAELARIEAEGAIDGLALAGSVAGIVTTPACQQSAQAAVAGLFSRRQPPVEDRPLSPIYETPDAPTSIARLGAPGLAYLDSGVSLTVRPALPRPRRFKVLGGDDGPRFPFAEQAYALSLGDVAAAVQIGAVPEADTAIVTAERCIVAGDLIDAARQQPVAPPNGHAPAPEIPDFLVGRFGPRPGLWRLAAVDGRRFEPGCLIHVNSDARNPLLAIGVILGPVGEGEARAYALIGKAGLAPGDTLVVRDGSGPVTARLVDRYRAGEDDSVEVAPEPVPPAAEPPPAAAETPPAETPAAEAVAPGPEAVPAEAETPAGASEQVEKSEA